MKILLASAVLLASLAPAASAQFSQFPWTATNPGGNGHTHQTETTMGLLGTTDQTSGDILKYTTASHVSGRVTVQAIVMPEDAVCTSTGFPSASVASIIVNGQLITYATCFFASTLSFDVVELQQFGFALQTFDIFWPYGSSYSNFTFEPYWALLGNALAGSAGTPSLRGLGVLQPGEPMSVALSMAKPGAAAALVIGFGAGNIPFKGGVLVPTPDLVLAGLPVSGAGTLSLAGTWPAGVTVPVFMQAWIADSAGPQGFAASNGLKANIL
jgi:hypothetical protein